MILVENPDEETDPPSGAHGGRADRDLHGQLQSGRYRAGD
jgi:hypothetical protein